MTQEFSLIFLLSALQQHQDYSEATAVVIDNEVRSFIEKAETVATNILKEQIDKLHDLAKALLEREILDSGEVDEIIGLVSGDMEPLEKPAPTPES